jgi:hypothetical protein
MSKTVLVSAGDEIMTEEEKETEECLAILSGRAVPDANPDIIREAQALRIELEARINPPNPERLKTIFQKTGLKPGWRRDLETIGQKIMVLFESVWQWKLPFPVVAVTVLLLLVIMSFFKPVMISNPETNIITATPKSSLVVQEIFVSNPETEAEALTMGLAKLGVRVNLARDEGIWRVEVDNLATDNPEALSILLDKHSLVRLPPPMSEQLRVHILKQ